VINSLLFSEDFPHFSICEKSAGLGLYIHVPFCASRCAYCDFATDLEAPLQRKLYLETLVDEIRSYEGREFELDSIYFGGGTPSLLKPPELALILKEVISRWPLLEGAEISLEANPETVCKESLSQWMDAGINRISLGVQSFEQSELKALGRSHLLLENTQAIELIAKSALRFNLDLMLGIPHQSLFSLRQSLDFAVGSGAEHLSIYMLSIEPEAPWFDAINKGRIQVASDEMVAEFYNEVLDRLARLGLPQYEISAFSNGGKECRHNLKYWRNEDFLGLGPSAASHFRGLRKGNRRAILDWVSQVKNKKKPDYFEQNHSKNAILETIMLQSRLNEGLFLPKLEIWDRRFPELEIFQRLDHLMGRGLIEIFERTYRLTRMGLLFANEVFEQFID
jgi:oxygen-independent coproporphyrinogen III oxidase